MECLTLFILLIFLVPDEIKNKSWYVDVDCSEMISRIICTLNKGKSLEPIHHENLETYKRLRRK